MASPVSHAIVAVTIGMAFPQPRPLGRYCLAVAVSVLPDIDVIGSFNGVEYGSLLGHRGLTHSLAFAAIVAGILITIPAIGSPSWGPRWPAWVSRSSHRSATRGTFFRGDPLWLDPSTSSVPSPRGD